MRTIIHEWISFSYSSTIKKKKRNFEILSVCRETVLDRLKKYLTVSWMFHCTFNALCRTASGVFLIFIPSRSPITTADGFICCVFVGIEYLRHFRLLITQMSTCRHQRTRRCTHPCPPLMSFPSTKTRLDWEQSNKHAISDCLKLHSNFSYFPPKM